MPFLHKQSAKHKNKEIQAEAELKTKQLSTREQCVGLIGEEFTKKWEALPSNVKVFLADTSKADFAKQTSAIKKCQCGLLSKYPKKIKIKTKTIPKLQFLNRKWYLKLFNRQTLQTSQLTFNIPT